MRVCFLWTRWHLFAVIDVARSGAPSITIFFTIQHIYMQYDTISLFSEVVLIKLETIRPVNSDTNYFVQVHGNITSGIK